MTEKPYIAATKKPLYKERAKSQCLSWAMGNVYHNNIDNECCPDFSCCVPELYKNVDERWAYYHDKFGAMH